MAKVQFLHAWAARLPNAAMGLYKLRQLRVCRSFASNGDLKLKRSDGDQSWADATADDIWGWTVGENTSAKYQNMMFSAI